MADLDPIKITAARCARIGDAIATVLAASDAQPALLSGKHGEYAPLPPEKPRSLFVPLEDDWVSPTGRPNPELTATARPFPRPGDDDREALFAEMQATEPPTPVAVEVAVEAVEVADGVESGWLRRALARLFGGRA